MQVGSAFLIFFPIFLEGCCVRNHHEKSTVSHQNTTHQHYFAVEGEMMRMPCVKASKQRMETLWFRSEEGEVNNQTHLNCMTAFVAEAKHSGNYTSTIRKHVLQLQVLGKHLHECFQPEKSSRYLIAAACGKLRCPAFFCGGSTTEVVWFKGHRAARELPRHSCETDELLHFRVSDRDSGLYFCDRLIFDRGVPGTLRRAVNVTAIPFERARTPPRIPEGNKTEEVELGQPHNLTCNVYFDFELEFSPNVQWYMNYDGNTENAILLHMDAPQQRRVKFAEYEVTRSVIIEEVTPAHLNHTYTCIARNTVGHHSVTFKLKRKAKVKWPSLVGYPIASLLLVVGLGAILHVKWLEIHLFYKSYFKYGKHDGDEKDFDVFLSYFWSCPSADVSNTSSLSSSSEFTKEEEELFPHMNLLNMDSQTSLQVLLPDLLEDHWGYRVCLLERDVVPGGAYTNDVVLAIKRSRMLICVLSAEYLNNTNAVFVLESGIQALLQRSAFKLLLIRTNRTSMLLVPPDPPLPELVQRALRVLPSLDWSAKYPARENSNFWKSLKKSLPRTKSDAAHSCITPRVGFYQS